MDICTSKTDPGSRSAYWTSIGIEVLMHSEAVRVDQFLLRTLGLEADRSGET